MNKGALVQSYAHQLLEELNSSAQISAFQILALVSTVSLCLWRWESHAGEALLIQCGWGLGPTLVTLISSAWAEPGTSGLKHLQQ